MLSNVLRAWGVAAHPAYISSSLLLTREVAAEGRAEEQAVHLPELLERRRRR
jgi:hypothetical protein